MNFQKRAEELQNEMVKNRRYLHENAELSFKEVKTTKFLVDKLEELGIPVQTFPDYLGCIATISGGATDGNKKNKTVLLRADIDALPIVEQSGVSFSSKNDGIMHACGHDCHATMLLGAGKLLWEEREKLQGTVKLLFQSAEEEFIGSHYYVNEGHLDNIDAAMGMHVWVDEPSKKLGIRDGQLMASCDNFTITINGTGTHGATPHLGNDALVASCSVISNIQTIVSRNNDPIDSLVVSIGTIRAGSQFNIITDTAVMEGTIRTHSKKARTMAIEKLKHIVETTAESMGCTGKLEFSFAEGPVNNEDLALNDLARKSAVKMYGEDVLIDIPKVGGSEDFSYIMEKIPSSLFIFLGCRNEEKGAIHPLHNEKLVIDEDILQYGAGEYAQFAFDYLESNLGEDK